MDSKVKYVKNPLSIIALFASLSEAIATGVLPFLSGELQKIFIWFVMGFPVMLVSLFFYTLHKKHHVLYAPSDYKSDESFTGLALDIRAQNKIEIMAKNREELIEIENHQDDEQKTASAFQTFVNNPKIEYFLAEELALKKLSEKYGDCLLTNQVLKINNNQYQVDGLVNTTSELSIYEIKYFPRLMTPLNGIGRTYSYFEEINKNINANEYLFATYNIIIVTSINDEEKKKLLERVKDMLLNRKLKINLSVYDFQELKKEFGLEN